MKHIKLYEQFVSEAFITTRGSGKDLDKDLAEIVLRHILSSDGDRKFDETVFFSLNDREAIKSQYGRRLPNSLAGPTKSMLASQILSPLVGQDVYVDGRTYLVAGDKTMLVLKSGTTWNDVADALNLKN